MPSRLNPVEKFFFMIIGIIGLLALPKVHEEPGRIILTLISVGVCILALVAPAERRRVQRKGTEE